MIWIIVIIIVIITIKFFYDKSQQASKIAKEGGMRNKYRDLIGYIMESDPKTKILHEDSDSITVGVSTIGGTTLFILTQTFGKLTVQWKVDSPVFGKHKMEWDFPEYGDPEKMIARIANDLSKYQNNIMQNLM